MSSLIEDSKGFDLPIKNGLIRYWRAKDVRRDKNNNVIAIQEYITKSLDSSITTGAFTFKKVDTAFNGLETFESKNIEPATFNEVSLLSDSFTVYVVLKKITGTLLQDYTIVKQGVSGFRCSNTLESNIGNQIRADIVYPADSNLKLVTFVQNVIKENNVQVVYDNQQAQTNYIQLNQLSSASFDKYAEIAIFNVKHTDLQMTEMWNHFNIKYGIDNVVYPDLMFHLDASIGITTVNDGEFDRVDSWADQSTYLRHAVATTALLRPRYIASDPDFNNLPSVFADISQRVLKHPMLFAKNYTLHYVIKETTARSYAQFHSLTDAILTKSNEINLNGSFCNIICRRAIGTTIRQSTVNIFNLSKVISITKNKIYVNGIETGYSTNQNIYGGCGFQYLFSFNSTYYFTGKIAEIKGYCSEHSDSQILNEAQSLMAKYGIA